MVLIDRFNNFKQLIYMGEVTSAASVRRGISLRTVRLKLDAKEIQEFLDAIGEYSPLYRDPDVAKKAGFLDLPAPPTYHSALLFHAYDGLFPELERMGIDTKRILHVKEEYEYHLPLYAGMEITLTGRILDVKGEKRTMILFETLLHDDGVLYSRGKSTIFLQPLEKPGAGP